MAIDNAEPLASAATTVDQRSDGDPADASAPGSSGATALDTDEEATTAPGD